MEKENQTTKPTTNENAEEGKVGGPDWGQTVDKEALLPDGNLEDMLDSLDIDLLPDVKNDGSGNTGTEEPLHLANSFEDKERMRRHMPPLPTSHVDHDPYWEAFAFDKNILKKQQREFERKRNEAFDARAHQQRKEQNGGNVEGPQEHRGGSQSTSATSMAPLHGTSYGGGAGKDISAVAPIDKSM